MLSPISGIAWSNASCAWRGKWKLCNTVPWKIVLRNQVRRKVSTPSLNSIEITLLMVQVTWMSQLQHASETYATTTTTTSSMKYGTPWPSGKHASQCTSTAPVIYTPLSPQTPGITNISCHLQNHDCHWLNQVTFCSDMRQLQQQFSSFHKYGPFTHRHAGETHTKKNSLKILIPF